MEPTYPHSAAPSSVSAPVKPGAEEFLLFLLCKFAGRHPSIPRNAAFQTLRQRTNSLRLFITSSGCLYRRGVTLHKVVTRLGGEWSPEGFVAWLRSFCSLPGKGSLANKQGECREPSPCLSLSSLSGLPELLLLVPAHSSSIWTLQRWQLQQQDLVEIKTWHREALMSCSFYLVAHF